MVSAIASIAIGLGLQSGAFAYSFSGPTISTNSYTVPQGAKLEVFCTGYVPDEIVSLTLMSTPVALGTVMMNSLGAGSTQVTIPANTPLGNHTIVGTGTTGDTARTGIFVTGAPIPLSTVTSSGGGLAFTGADIAAATGVGVIAIGLGGMLLLANRRRRANHG